MLEKIDKKRNKAYKKIGLSYEEQKRFHIKVGIFTNGIACLVETKTVEFSDKEIEEMLEKTVLEMLCGLRESEKKGY